jgi:hypothetical protein
MPASRKKKKRKKSFLLWFLCRSDSHKHAGDECDQKENATTEKKNLRREVFICGQTPRRQGTAERDIGPGCKRELVDKARACKRKTKEDFCFGIQLASHNAARDDVPLPFCARK